MESHLHTLKRLKALVSDREDVLYANCNGSCLAFKSDTFSNQYTGATNAGIIRGAYHFAHPDSSTGAAQANFFLANGGTLFIGLI
jgi:hypothetical protein